MKKAAHLQEKMLAMNEALILGSVRQHELTETAENLNAQLELKNVKEAHRRLKVLTASNRKLKGEIVRREVVEKALLKSRQHQDKLLMQSRQMHAQLRSLSHQILMAQEEERKNISRELHDEIAQSLAGINVYLATLKKKAAHNTTGLDRHINRTQRLVEKSVKSVHEFARELRPAVLDDLGLVPALQTFVKTFSRRFGLRVAMHLSRAVEKLDGHQRTVLYRIAQEALTNVARHAQARSVKIVIQKHARHLGMKIHDDGKSFEVERVWQATGKHLGLLGMRERVEMIGGEFCVESAPGAGTTIHVDIPLHEPKHAAKKSAVQTPLECP